MKEQFIPCPNCQTQIQFDVEELLKGKTFSCSNCQTPIGIQPNDINDTKQDVLRNLEDLKRGVNKDHPPR